MIKLKNRITLQPMFDYRILLRSLLRTTNDASIISNSARSSFDLSLYSILKQNKYKSILIPDFICSEIIPIIQKHKLNIIFYSINETLDPDIDIISSKLKLESSIILLVNYFGKSSDWKSAQELKKRYDCIIIEDNAHSLFGQYNETEFGELGDISFNSLRKSLPVLSGSVLRFNKHDNVNKKLKTRFLDIAEFKYSLRRFKPYFKNHILTSSNKDIQTTYDDTQSIDYFSNKIYLYLTNQREAICSQRILNYNYWVDFHKKSDLEIIDLSSAKCPYAAPFICSDFKTCEKWLKWGEKNNIGIIKWPNLPNLESHNLKNKKLENVILFPVNHMHDLTKINLLNA